MVISVFSPMHKKKVVAGEFSNGVFTKNCKPWYKMLTEGGFGISESAITKLKELGCHTVVIQVDKTEVKRIPFADLLKAEIKTYQSDKQRFVKVA